MTSAAVTPKESIPANTRPSDAKSIAPTSYRQGPSPPVFQGPSPGNATADSPDVSQGHGEGTIPHSGSSPERPGSNLNLTKIR